MLVRSAGVLLLAATIGVAVLIALSHRAEIAPISGKPPVDRTLAERGLILAQIGNCNVCHTAPGGEPYAGGLGLQTPFGTIYSTNITPEPETGIGDWSEAAFSRAMREGVDRRGRHLYPAFPYDHFTLVSDEDNRALYAFLMSREPVKAEAPRNDLPFPLNWRPLLAGWNLLFLDRGAYEPDRTQSAEWNRGAYLAEGLGHCGACHTPRNALGAEKQDQQFAGGEAEGWYAYAINARSPSPVPWSVESLTQYLKLGWHQNHGISRGAMAPVTTNLASVPDEDVRALAVYVTSKMGEITPEKRQRGDQALAAARQPIPEGRAATADSQPGSHAADPGETIYVAACASCHDGKRPLPYGGINLHLSTAVNGPNPDNIINVVLHGLPPSSGEASPIMPGFHNVLTDQQLISLLAYMRSAFSDEQPWPSLSEDVRRAKDRTATLAVRPTDGASAAPADPQARETPW